MKLARTSTMSALALLLAACGAGGTESAAMPAASPPAPSVTRDARYSDAVQLKDAAVLAGYSCPSWTPAQEMVDASSRGSCSDADVFSIFPSDAALDRTVSFLRDAGLGTVLLVGPNWTINSEKGQLEAIRGTLGGVVVQATSS